MKVWLRLGVTLDVTEENGAKILAGDGDVLTSIIKSPDENNKWKIDGDTYIPGSIMEEFGFECADVNFDL